MIKTAVRSPVVARPLRTTSPRPRPRPRRGPPPFPARAALDTIVSTSLHRALDRVGPGRGRGNLGGDESVVVAPRAHRGYRGAEAARAGFRRPGFNSPVPRRLRRPVLFLLPLLLLLLLLLPVLLPLLLPLPILLAHLALAHTPRVLAIAPARQPSLAVRLQLLPKRRRLPLRRLRVRLQLTLALLLRAFELLQRRALKVLQRPEVRLLPRGGVVRRVELVALEPDVGGRVPAAAVVAAHVVRPVAAVHRER
mmetsp:Transcript_1973/g.7679  ORF Transcript_1973/g.7679 Transcript_1973/m.7679 type:complete len:252 (-) Transcript_1973:18-773(-)